MLGADRVEAAIRIYGFRVAVVREVVYRTGAVVVEGFGIDISGIPAHEALVAVEILRIVFRDLGLSIGWFRVKNRLVHCRRWVGMIGGGAGDIRSLRVLKLTVAPCCA